MMTPVRFRSSFFKRIFHDGFRTRGCQTLTICHEDFFLVCNRISLSFDCTHFIIDEILNGFATFSITCDIAHILKAVSNLIDRIFTDSINRCIQLGSTSIQVRIFEQVYYDVRMNVIYSFCAHRFIVWIDRRKVT